MGMVFGILSSLISLALLVGVIVLIVNATRRHGAGGVVVDARSVRRFFQYLLLYILAVVVTVGVADLIGLGFGTQPKEWQDTSDVLARALAFVIIGAPLAALLARWTIKTHRADAGEADSPLFTVFLTLTALTALVTAMFSLVSVIAEAIGRSRFNGEAAGVFIAWTALWVLLWIANRRFLDEERGVLHLILGSLIGLVVGVIGLVSTLGNSLDLLLRPGAFVNPNVALATGAGMLIAGGAVWVRYWATSAMNQPRRTLWLAYVLLAGVGGGLILWLVAASRVLWNVLVWFAGDHPDQTAAQHFDTIATEAAAVAIGLLVWWYHRALLGESASERSEVRRVYEYLVSGIALIAAAIGVGTVIVAFIESATPGTDVGMTTKNTLLAAVTLLVVGVPVWAVYWRGISAAVAANPTAEVPSITRRIYLVALFGIAGITAVVALLAVGYVFFQDLVAAQIGAATLRSMRYGLGVLVASAAVSAYHGTIFRADRAAAVVAPAAVAGPRSVVLVGADDPGLIRGVHQATGAHVEVWPRLDAAPEPWDEASVVEAVRGYAGQNVLVIAEGSQLRVLVVGPQRR